MTQAILSQLIKAESQLTEQEATLTAQISTLQEKRRGLQSVISMFESSDSESISVPVLDAPVVEAKPQKRRGRKPKAASATSKSAASKKATKSTASKSTAAKSTASKSTAAKSSTTTTSAVKQSGTRRRGGRKANWQTYVRPSYNDTPLPEVVESVLKTKPRSRFKIAEVMTEIFQDDMPKTQFLKARNRISNILSAGARSGDWHRGRGGTYSVSEKAVG